MAKCTNPSCKSTSFKMEIVEVKNSDFKFRAITCSSCETIISFLDYTNSTKSFRDIKAKLGIMT